jgi:prepilin-type N-terminal cleavage/methylation domain-containing protein
MIKHRNHNNRGFSLVELIVVVAILAVVGGAIAGFIATSTRSYRNVSNEVDLQEEAQIAMNQLESLLMNAEAGVNYMYFGQSIPDDPADASTDVNGQVFSDAEIDSSTVDISQKYIYIYNTKSRYVITWNEDEQRLYYKEEARETDPVTGSYTANFTETADDGALFAEYVDDFSVTLSSSGQSVVVNVALHLTRGDRQYQAKENISLRNSIMLNEEVASIYDVDPGLVTTATYTGITVRLGTSNFSTGSTGAYDVFLSGGGDVTIPLSVTILGNAFPSQEYTCTFSDGTVTDASATSAGSSAGAGSVVVSGSESASSITMTVASKVDPSVKCSVSLNIKQITGITVTLGSGITENSFRAGAELTLNEDFQASVTGTGLSVDDRKYTWSAGSNCSIQNGNILKISTDASAVNQPFTLTATSVSDPSVSYTYTGTVLPRSTTLFVSGNGTVNRGGSIQMTAKDADTSTAADYGAGDIAWSVSVDHSGRGVSISDTGVLTVSKDLDYNTAYTITVTATLTYATSVSKSVTVEVPAVSVQYSSSLNGAYTDSYTVPMMNIANGNSATVYYKVTGVEGGSLSGFRWNKDSASGDDRTSAFSRTVSISENRITLNKTDIPVSWGTSSYDNYVDLMCGTPKVDGKEITTSSLKINNNQYSKNVDIGGAGYNYNYYIPVAATNGWQNLSGTSYVYYVSYVTVNDQWNPYSYYQLAVYDYTNQQTYYYYAWNTSSSWTRNQ